MNDGLLRHVAPRNDGEIGSLDDNRGDGYPKTKPPQNAGVIVVTVKPRFHFIASRLLLA